MNLEEKIDHILRKVDKIDRGMYGDADNKTPGLIDRQISDEARIAALEKTDEKRKWWAAGFSAAISLVISFVVWLVKEMWGK